MPAAQAPVAAPRRSPALERRLRQRRTDARLRVHLLADIGVLDAHHASSPPRLAGGAHLVESRRFLALAERVEASHAMLLALTATVQQLVVLLAPASDNVAAPNSEFVTSQTAPLGPDAGDAPPGAPAEVLRHDLGSQVSGIVRAECPPHPKRVRVGAVGVPGPPDADMDGSLAGGLRAGSAASSPQAAIGPAHEKRIDPGDGLLWTYVGLVDGCKDNYSMDEIIAYWDSMPLYTGLCRPIPASAVPDHQDADMQFVAW